MADRRAAPGNNTHAHMKSNLQHRPLLAALGAALAAGTILQPALAGSITSVGDFVDGYWSRALAISADGQTVAGTAYLLDGSRHAYRWTSATGIVDLGALNAATDNGLAALSSNGSVGAGWSGIDSVRWTAAGGLSPLGHRIAGSTSTATAMSGDGGTIVGFENLVPFKWTSSGLVALGIPAGETTGRPGAITRDAAFVGGAAGLNLVRWSGTTPTKVAAFAADAGVSGFGISDDGAVLVGQVVHPGGNSAEGVRWVEGVGATLLGDVVGGDFNSVAFSTTADGQTLVGFGSTTSFFSTATIWTSATGWQRLADVLAAQGVDLSYWDSLDEATSISPDGSVIAGSGTVAGTFNQEAFVARLTPLPVPAPAPFTGVAKALPGRVQTEDYDKGGQLVGYFDTTAGNTGGAYRTDGVDITANSDGAGGTAVTLATREWLDYSVNVATAGNYVLRFRVSRAATGAGALKVSTGPANASLTPLVASLAVPSTGSASRYTVIETDVALVAGNQLVRVQCVTGDFNVNWLEVTPRGIRREVWTGVTGDKVSQIPVNRTPNSTDILATTETPQNGADNYGTRLRGYLRVPTTGAYRFWVAADDSSELWLSTSVDPAAKSRIANNNSYTGFRQWTKFGSQKSAAINLTAGQLCYIEILQKEGNGSDNLSVGWSRPGQATSAPTEIIPTAVLSPFIP